jgi:hypothetical protein
VDPTFSKNPKNKPLSAVWEAHHAADLEAVGVGELLPAIVKEHVPFPVQQHLDKPPADATAGFLQVHANRLLGEILSELIWEPF